MSFDSTHSRLCRDLRASSLVTFAVLAVATLLTGCAGHGENLFGSSAGESTGGAASSGASGDAPGGTGGNGADGGNGPTGSAGQGSPLPGIRPDDPLSGDGCAGAACLNPDCQPYQGNAAPLDPFPNTGFDDKPAFIPNDVIIPTLDDAPDGADPSSDAYAPGSWTRSILSYFAANDLHWDFFMNTDNWCGPVLGSSADDPECDRDFIEILRHHNAGSHTVHHVHMGSDIPPDADHVVQSCDGPSSMNTCDSELAGVETVVNRLSNGGTPHLTRFRPPFGEPFQGGGPGLSTVQAVVAKYAVVVGWNLDSGDSSYHGRSCAKSPCPTGAGIAGVVQGLIGPAPGMGTNHGILLMHGTYRWTHEAIQLLFAPKTGYVASHGFRVGTVEDAICWKYGMHSWQIVERLSGQARSAN